MTQEEILEGNKLIAEFMGAEKSHFGDYLIYPINTDKNAFGKTDYADIKYHSSWDWLMPVLRNIKDYLNNIERPSRNHCCKGDSIEVDIQCALWEMDIENTNKYVIEFIKWYNTQNK